MTDERLVRLREAGRKGGLKGGKAQVPKGVAKLTPERRREIALAGVEGRRRKREETKN